MNLTKHYLPILFLLITCQSIGQSTNQLLKTYETGTNSEKVRAAEELMKHYISENKDTLEVLGEELFYYGIENHYYPAIETGKIILAEFYVETGKTKDGITLAKSLMSTVEERGDVERLAVLSKLICQGYRFDKDASSAMYWAKQAVKYSKMSQDPEVRTYGHLSLAESHVLIKKPKEAIKLFKEYLDLARPLKLNQGMCSAYSRLGDLYRIQGDLDKAEYYFNAAYKLSTKIQRKVAIGHAINNLAIVYFERGDTLKARNFFQKGLEIRLLNKDVNAIAESYYNMGDYQFYINKPLLAIQWYKKSLEFSKKHKLNAQSKDVLYVLANAYKSLDQLEMANKCLEEYIDFEDIIFDQNQKDEQKIKEMQLEFMRLEFEAEKDGYVTEDDFLSKIKTEWIAIVLLGLLSIFLAYKLRKFNKSN